VAAIPREDAVHELWEVLQAVKLKITGVGALLLDQNGPLVSYVFLNLFNRV